MKGPRLRGTLLVTWKLWERKDQLGNGVPVFSLENVYPEMVRKGLGCSGSICPSMRYKAMRVGKSLLLEHVEQEE